MDGPIGASVTLLPLLALALAARSAPPPRPSAPAPVVLALQGGEVVPLLGLSRAPEKDGALGPLHVVYWAGPDPAVLVRFLWVKDEVERVEDVTVRMGADGVWRGP